MPPRAPAGVLGDAPPNDSASKRHAPGPSRRRLRTPPRPGGLGSMPNLVPISCPVSLPSCGPCSTRRSYSLKSPGSRPRGSRGLRECTARRSCARDLPRVRRARGGRAHTPACQAPGRAGPARRCTRKRLSGCPQRATTRLRF